MARLRVPGGGWALDSSSQQKVIRIGPALLAGWQSVERDMGHHVCSEVPKEGWGAALKSKEKLLPIFSSPPSPTAHLASLRKRASFFSTCVPLAPSSPEGWDWGKTVPTTDQLCCCFTVLVLSSWFFHWRRDCPAGPCIERESRVPCSSPRWLPFLCRLVPSDL